MKTKILLKKLGPPILVLASLVLGTSQSQIQSAPPPGPVQQAWVARYNGPGNLDVWGAEWRRNSLPAEAVET